MMSTGTLIGGAVALGSVLAGGGLLVLVRRKIVPKSMILGAVVSTILTLIFGNVALWSMAIDTTGNPAATLILVFLGMLSIQPRPFCALAIYQPLAVISGIIAGLAAWDGNLLVTTLAIGVTAMLLHLHDQDSSRANH